jgi:hypothetical protein
MTVPCVVTMLQVLTAVLIIQIFCGVTLCPFVIICCLVEGFLPPYLVS